MSYATDMKAVQKIVDNIGSINNLSLTRIGNARKCIFVEGDDLKILAKYADILYPKLTESINNLPHVSLGGFNNLQEARHPAHGSDRHSYPPQYHRKCSAYSLRGPGYALPWCTYWERKRSHRQPH